MTKQSKRILSVKLVQSHDIDGDTSYYGEYSNSKTSEFSIDREHALDCSSQEHNHRESVDRLERAIEYLNRSGEELVGEAFDDALTILGDAQDTAQGCDCDGRGDRLRLEYQYFNPSENYVDKFGRAADGNTPEDVRKYVRQDYAHMEDLNKGYWSFLHIRAEAVVNLNGVELELTSVGCGGVESDDGSVKEVSTEELHDLSEQLHKLGFSNRAVATAFKNTEVV